ncbi:energy-coupling factor transporter transmembrane component T [Labedella endophytica]|uniref:Energy-coupling factor transporter transmembrane protein EcfT n=1 Tax=Labedella endophytica TaxID=1523160 RepID=A0A433JX51_9MICO|nr:energy-coupling factor transporter transmembrane component T [Labedella endophytica]RUR03457.1 energy-coupling factor transporter transmembrane protein EcfT [Labedella endophytica]
MNATGARRGGFLHGLNPLVKIVAPLPAMVAVIVSRDIATPLAVLALALSVLLVGARPSARTVLLLLLGLPLVVTVGALGFGVWSNPAAVDQSVLLVQVGEYRLFLGSLAAGLAAALRLAALLLLALIAGLTTDGSDFVRSTVQHLRVPYRIGYTALAAYRFVPRFRHDIELIRHAHRVRGTGGRRGPVAAVRRFTGSVVPLLAGAIRHAERVALAMDARAFGAHPTRTERHLVPLRRRDGVFTVVFWIATAAVVVAVRAAV